MARNLLVHNSCLLSHILLSIRGMACRNHPAAATYFHTILLIWLSRVKQQSENVLTLPRLHIHVAHLHQAAASPPAASNATATSAPSPTPLSSSSRDAAAATASASGSRDAAAAAAGCPASLPPAFLVATALLWAAASAMRAAKQRCAAKHFQSSMSKRTMQHGLWT